MPPLKEASMASAKETFAALTIGKKVEVHKTVGETDIYLFAGITGDFARNHVDEEFMRRTRYGRRSRMALCSSVTCHAPPPRYAPGSTAPSSPMASRRSAFLPPPSSATRSP